MVDLVNGVNVAGVDVVDVIFAADVVDVAVMK